MFIFSPRWHLYADYGGRNWESIEVFPGMKIKNYTRTVGADFSCTNLLLVLELEEWFFDGWLKKNWTSQTNKKFIAKKFIFLLVTFYFIASGQIACTICISLHPSFSFVLPAIYLRIVGFHIDRDTINRLLIYSVLGSVICLHNETF